MESNLLSLNRLTLIEKEVPMAWRRIQPNLSLGIRFFYLIHLRTLTLMLLVKDKKMKPRKLFGRKGEIKC